MLAAGHRREAAPLFDEAAAADVGWSLGVAVSLS